MEDVYVEIELEDEYYIKGRVSRRELEEIRRGDIGSLLFHRTSGTIIISERRIVEIKEID